MTSAGGSSEGEPPPVDLGKHETPEPFDPYRFGKPDVPPPPQYAPPGYVPDPPAPTQPGAPGPGGPYPPMPSTQGPSPYGYQPPPYPGQYPGPPGYGPPPYAPYPGVRQGNGRATAGMVLGIVSIVLCWVNFFNLVIIVPGVVFSLLGLGAAKTRGTGRGQAIAGLICVTVGIVLTVVISIVEFHLIDSCAGIERGTHAYNRCVQGQL